MRKLQQPFLVLFLAVSKLSHNKRIGRGHWVRARVFKMAPARITTKTKTTARTSTKLVALHAVFVLFRTLFCSFWVYPELEASFLVPFIEGPLMQPQVFNEINFKNETVGEPQRPFQVRQRECCGNAGCLMSSRLHFSFSLHLNLRLGFCRLLFGLSAGSLQIFALLCLPVS